MTVMPRQTILFDLDDTLVHCNKYFDIVIQQFLDSMMTWFAPWKLPAEDIRAVQVRIDIAGVQDNGFHSEHFPRSFIQTYEHFCTLTGRAPAADESELLWKLGMSVYEFEIEPYPGMIDTLDRLRDDGHELFLYTGGEPVIQGRKIEQMKLSDYFGDRIFIRRHKTADALSSIVQEQGFRTESTWMIGNSLRTDVIPALLSGLNAIYLKQANEWAFNIVDIDAEPNGAFETIQQLTDVPRVIRNWILTLR
ncbi:HAD family hydrolase [Paenibacillus thiaminolyticus]|uniref:HAD family hydrolase n=1 Tax=Paenibacillus thiaminolyticus TaxID=49283 RepID=A0AAP9DUL6_PANTH|nr:HAD family hydrolase [Paenibacillus thiaminolyticus]MCY9536051.1 HAD family hydrolase [Paenibacillus thiaminolyticus]MCY9602288.1 HAD family hydrolase [Paenibacillus thiaminolyticus]MCY9608683.1 HAD family hydrolase [Paenibacillus thiaminolyticus]MCY9613429.1 HAD family hydrolase [Paenibacillus thiaminolyticus]MCY9620248.1 HAD family hydrolase [Paenibacillus thiaminolyticus]